jgi:hypothetical protein
MVENRKDTISPGGRKTPGKALVIAKNKIAPIQGN